MSEKLKRKLYNYEPDPPEVVWSRIVTTLDQEVDAEFPERLYALEVIPPPDTWNKIEKGLEQENKEQYLAKLYNIEVAPPPQAWNKILMLLDRRKSLPGTPKKGRIVSFVRYVAAACIIGVIAFAAFKILNQTTGNRRVAIKTVAPQKDSSSTSNHPTQQPIPSLSNNLPKESSSLAQIETKHRKKTLPEAATYMTQMAATFPAAAGSKSVSDFSQISLKGDIPGNCSLISDADPYLMFVNPDGYLIRISKKLAETLGCIYNNGNSAEYNRCQDQIKKWRDKIAQSPGTSSPDNFMDILNVIKTVQE